MPDANPTPRHVAIIMDGNGRWAKARGLPRLEGHKAGAETVRRVMRAAKKFGVEYLTLYAFSVENWSRPPAEIRGLMRLLRFFLKRNEKEFHDNKVRMRVMGRRSDLPASADKALAEVEAATAHYTEGQLILCLSYGGRTEIAAAARALAEDAAAGRLDPAAIDEKALASRLYLPDVPDPDLIVRTSGEERLSNFLLWQAAYAEFHFTPVAWPDFGEDDFRAALDAYARRHRRYGGL
ncbi:MAG: di-trans,poly-cis-decaprenylcistransferase [Kiritimatiellae bacterium]|nr:di-trans,poly-cis-decaprenylcistransferase [Kiritimatiellia bacterium]